MGLIRSTHHISNKKMLNHNGSEGDIIKISYTPNGGNEVVVLEYQVDTGKNANFKFELSEFTGQI